MMFADVISFILVSGPASLGLEVLISKIYNRLPWQPANNILPEIT